MNEPSNLFVVLMGMGTVFIGLICIIVFCKIIGLFCTIGDKKNETETKNTVSPVVENKGVAQNNRQEIIAAVCAVCAEEMGVDVNAIRVKSFKKL